MTSILMVCLGNICRSPLAHGILESKLPSDQFYVDSAGTANYHVGDSPDHRSIAIAKSHGIDISHQRGRQFKISDFDTFDYIFVMDPSNFNDIIKLARNTDDVAKVKLLLEIDDNTENKTVADPYYGNISDFESVYQLLDQVCDTLSEHLITRSQ